MNGFNIHVAGSGHFRYSRSNVDHGDYWEPTWLERQLLARVGIRARPSITGSATRHMLEAESRIVQVHLLCQAFEFLMTHGEGSLNATVSHLMWPGTGGFRRFSISGPDGVTATRELCRFLAHARMNQWGPILEIIGALTAFDSAYQGGGNYMINMELFDSR